MVARVFLFDRCGWLRPWGRQPVLFHIETRHGIECGPLYELQPLGNTEKYYVINFTAHDKGFKILETLMIYLQAMERGFSMTVNYVVCIAI